MLILLVRSAKHLIMCLRGGNICVGTSSKSLHDTASKTPITIQLVYGASFKALKRHVVSEAYIKMCFKLVVSRLL